MSTLIDTRQAGPFTIKTYALPEDISPRGQFMDEDLPDVIDGIESGRYEWFAAKVVAEWGGHRTRIRLPGRLPVQQLRGVRQWTGLPRRHDPRSSKPSRSPIAGTV